MFIQTEKLPDECEMRLWKEVFAFGPTSLNHESDLRKFPLASRLLAIDRYWGNIGKVPSLSKSQTGLTGFN